MPLFISVFPKENIILAGKVIHLAVLFIFSEFLFCMLHVKILVLKVVSLYCPTGNTEGSLISHAITFLQYVIVTMSTFISGDNMVFR